MSHGNYLRLRDLVLNQAEADVHANDPLGGVLTTEQMIERDRIVFIAARSSQTPIPWNFVSGYPTPLERVMAMHVGTTRECLETFSAGADGG